MSARNRKLSELRMIIAGTRSFNDYYLLCDEVDRFVRSFGFDTMNAEDMKRVTVLHGAARGADRLGHRWHSLRGTKVEPYPAHWKLYGLAAGPMRNAEMARKADALIAFWDEVSAGTKNMIKEAQLNGLDYEVVKIPYAPEGKVPSLAQVQIELFKPSTPSRG
jgi:hypothetical protein